MPRKDSKQGYVRAIQSWLRYVIREAARRDPKTAHVLAIQRWDRQHWQATHQEHKNRDCKGLAGQPLEDTHQVDAGLLKLALYDEHLGGVLERLFRHYAISRWPDFDNPPDIVALFKNLTSENLPALLDALRGRLIERLYRPDAIDQANHLDDPFDIVAPLETFTRDELQRVTQVLYDVLPLPRKPGPRGPPSKVDLLDVDLWLDVESLPSKSVTRACKDVASKHERSRHHTNDAGRKRYARANERLKRLK